MSSNAIPGFFGSLFGELLLDRDCASIEQDPRADPVDKEICQQFRKFNEALVHGFHIEHRPPDEGPGVQPKDTDPQSLRDSILNRPKERREESPSRWPGFHRRQPKVDQDLDSSVGRDPHLLDHFLGEEDETQQAESHTQPRTHSSYSSSSVVITTRPDGTYEERRTVRDSDGNEEVTVTYSDGQKTRTEVHKTTKDGTTVSKTEEKEGGQAKHDSRSRLSDWLWSIR